MNLCCRKHPWRRFWCHSDPVLYVVDSDPLYMWDFQDHCPKCYLHNSDLIRLHRLLPFFIIGRAFISFFISFAAQIVIKIRNSVVILPRVGWFFNNTCSRSRLKWFRWGRINFLSGSLTGNDSLKELKLFVLKIFVTCFDAINFIPLVEIIFWFRIRAHINLFC